MSVLFGVWYLCFNRNSCVCVFDASPSAARVHVFPAVCYSLVLSAFPPPPAAGLSAHKAALAVMELQLLLCQQLLLNWFF